MRHCVLAAGLLLIAGCGDVLAPKPPQPPASASESLGVEKDRMSMEARGVDLRLFDTRQTDGESRKPTLWLHADTFTLEEQNISSFKNARAVVYGKDAATEEITLEAGAGRFQESKMAYMKDGVVARIGKLTLQLEDFEWLNETREGKTDHPVSVTSDAAHLTASSMRLYPETRKIELVSVAGSMRFEGIMK